MPTESGEFDNILSFPPKPIIARPPEIKSAEISSALESKIQSLLGEIIVCHKPWNKDATECKQCLHRLNLVEAIRVQLKAELNVVRDLREKIDEQSDVDMALKAYIDFNEKPGRATEIIQEYKKAHILRIK